MSGAAGEADLLRVEGGLQLLDLDGVAGTTITDIEIIGLTGSGDNQLRLSAVDVLAISSTDTLRVDGNAGDFVQSTGQGWTASGTVEVFPGVNYQSYTAGAATLLLHPDIVATSTIT
jgi:hypothetical protein